MSFKRQTFRLVVCAPFNYKLQLQHTNEISFSFHAMRAMQRHRESMARYSDNDDDDDDDGRQQQTRQQQHRVTAIRPSCVPFNPNRTYGTAEDCMFLFGSFAFSLNIPHQGAGLQYIALENGTVKKQRIKNNHTARNRTTHNRTRTVEISVHEFSKQCTDTAWAPTKHNVRTLNRKVNFQFSFVSNVEPSSFQIQTNFVFFAKRKRRKKRLPKKSRTKKRIERKRNREEKKVIEKRPQIVWETKSEKNRQASRKQQQQPKRHS